jgi:choline dehydrogenase-like flavoprotein
MILLRYEIDDDEDKGGVEFIVPDTVHMAGGCRMGYNLADSVVNRSHCIYRKDLCLKLLQ